MSEREAGFTLLETLVAFAILMLALGALMPLFSELLDRSGRASEDVQASALARALIDRVGSELPLVDGIRSGEDAGYVWQLRIEPYGSTDDRQSWTADAHEISATVVWRAAGRRRDVSLSTLRLGPQALKP